MDTESSRAGSDRLSQASVNNYGSSDEGSSSTHFDFGEEASGGWWPAWLARLFGLTKMPGS